MGMRLSKWIAISTGVLVLAVSGGALAVGNYVYTSGTVVPCAINEDDLANSPEAFYTQPKVMVHSQVRAGTSGLDMT